MRILAFVTALLMAPVAAADPPAMTAAPRLPVLTLAPADGVEVAVSAAPDKAAEAARVIAAVNTGLSSANAQLRAAPIPLDFWSSKAGVALTITISVAIGVTTAAGAAIGVYEASK